MSDMPEGVKSVMFLRDGWPDAIACKVVMQDDCVGIGLFRSRGSKFSPSDMDQLAMIDAMHHLSQRPADYTDIQEYVAKMKVGAEGEK